MNNIHIIVFCTLVLVSIPFYFTKTSFSLMKWLTAEAADNPKKYFIKQILVIFVSITAMVIAAIFSPYATILYVILGSIIEFLPARKAQQAKIRDRVVEDILQQ